MTIQEAGTQILLGNPQKFYIFCGTDYGVKDHYLTALKKHYGSYKEVRCVEDILKMMRTKQLIPLQPELYIVRYDESFLSSMSDKTLNYISKSKIIGTIVVIYQASKEFTKCDKYLKEYTVSLDPMADHFIVKHLTKEFPGMDTSLIKFAVKYRDDYYSAKLLCNLLNQVGESSIDPESNQTLETFYCSTESADEHIKIGIAAKNFKYLIDALDAYPGELDSILYQILYTAVELDKLKAKPYTDSVLQPYVKNWQPVDIYNIYMHTYKALATLRSISSGVYDMLVYLFGLLQYSTIPTVEDLEVAL